jgi:hypothetical protein
VAHGLTWLQALLSLPFGATQATLCARTGVAEIKSAIVKSEAHNRLNFLMILLQMDYQPLQITPRNTSATWEFVIRSIRPVNNREKSNIPTAYSLTLWQRANRNGMPSSGCNLA